MTSRDFHTDADWIEVQVGDKNLADHCVKGMFFGANPLHLGGKWPNDPVCEKHAEESTNKRTADHAAKNFRRLVN